MWQWFRNCVRCDSCVTKISNALPLSQQEFDDVPLFFVFCQEPRFKGSLPLRSPISFPRICIVVALLHLNAISRMSPVTRGSIYACRAPRPLRAAESNPTSFPRRCALVFQVRVAGPEENSPYYCASVRSMRKGRPAAIETGQGRGHRDAGFTLYASRVPQLRTSVRGFRGIDFHNPLFTLLPRSVKHHP